MVASRKINKDQQAQILKIPSLKASLSQLEEQISQYKKFDQEYKAKSQAEKAEFEKSFTERSGKELEDAVASAKADVKASAVKEQQDNLLLVSQFLRLAAIRRLEVERADEDLSKALEGLLATVYGGTTKAVTSIVNLIEGSSDLVKNVEEEDTTVTCKAAIFFPNLIDTDLYSCRDQGRNNRQGTGACGGRIQRRGD